MLLQEDIVNMEESEARRGPETVLIRLYVSTVDSYRNVKAVSPPHAVLDIVSELVDCQIS